MKPTAETRFAVVGFTYDPSSGAIFKNERRRDFAANGYRKVSSYKVLVLAHRLAWRLYYGTWPPTNLEIDHRNRNKQDNLIDNLRLATHGQNQANDSAMKNNDSGERGVYWDSRNRTWRISLYHNHSRFSSYASHKLSAIVAARLIRRVLHGEFAEMEAA